MRRRTFRDDERSASIAITHALTLAITAILVTALLVSAGNYLQSQQQAVARQQLQDVGGSLASLIGEADSLNSTGETVNATLSTSYPRRVAGEPYTVILIPERGDRTRATLYLNASAVDVSVEVAVATETPMDESRVRAGNPTVRLCPNGADPQSIALRRCSR